MTSFDLARVTPSSSQKAALVTPLLEKRKGGAIASFSRELTLLTHVDEKTHGLPFLELGAVFVLQLVDVVLQDCEFV